MYTRIGNHTNIKPTLDDRKKRYVNHWIEAQKTREWKAIPPDDPTVVGKAGGNKPYQIFGTLCNVLLGFFPDHVVSVHI